MDASIRQEASITDRGFLTLPIESIEPRIDLVGILLTLASHKWVIAATTLLAAGLSAFFALRQPSVYTADASVLPPPQTRPAVAAVLGPLTPAAGALSGGDFLRSPSDLYIALLSSRSVADGVIRDLHLRDHYHARAITHARSALAGRTAFSSGKDTLVHIRVSDRDPRAAAQIANAYIDQLYSLTSRFAVAESDQRRTFYEGQLAREKQELAAAEDEMRAIQQKTGLVQVNSQVEAVIRAVAQLRAEITSREVMLEGLQSGAAEGNPEVVRLRAELASLRERLARMESARTDSASAGPLLPAGQVPGAGLAYLRALRQLRYHESLFEALARQHEAARIDVAKEAAVVQVVDYAVPPEFPSGPRRRAFVLLVAMSAFVLSSAAALVYAKCTEPGSAARLRPLWRALWRLH